MYIHTCVGETALKWNSLYSHTCAHKLGSSITKIINCNVVMKGLSQEFYNEEVIQQLVCVCVVMWWGKGYIRCLRVF